MDEHLILFPTTDAYSRLPEFAWGWDTRSGNFRQDKNEFRGLVRSISEVPKGITTALGRRVLELVLLFNYERNWGIKCKKSRRFSVFGDLMTGSSDKKSTGKRKLERVNVGKCKQLYSILTLSAISACWMTFTQKQKLHSFFHLYTLPQIVAKWMLALNFLVTWADFLLNWFLSFNRKILRVP